MPLSEHEQRILAELEESLVRQDPRFAERVRSETVYRHAGRFCIWAAISFIVGVAVVVAFFSESVLAGLLGVAIMFGSAVVFERNMRRLGRASWHDFTQSLKGNRGPGSEGPIQSVREWLKNRFHRDS